MSLNRILVVFGFSASLLATQVVPTEEGARLDRLIATYTAERTALVRSTSKPAGNGLRIDHGPEGSPASAQKLADIAAGFVTQLAAIKTADLTHDQWILYGLVEYQAWMDAETTADFFWLPSLITPYSSPLRQLTTPFLSAPLKTEENLDAYIAALNQLPATMTAYADRLRQQADHGVVLPTDELRVAMPFVRSFDVAPPNSPFSVKAARLAAFRPDAQVAFQKKVDQTIAGTVNPAIEALLKYIDGPYRARSVTSVGLSQYPNGAAFYQHLIRTHTGLDLAPREIQDMGMREVARINDALDKVRQEAGFAGTLAEFKHYLRTDKRFYATSAQEIGDKMMAAIHLIEPKMSLYFSKMPAAPYGVRRLAPELEPSMTYGYYNLPDAADPKGYYNYNGLNPET